MAYAALVSLAQTIDLILNYHRDYITPQLENEIISIYDFVNYILQAFLEDFPEKTNSMEGRMREAAHAAEDVIEFLLSKQIHNLFSAHFKELETGCVEQCVGNPELSKHQRWEKYKQIGGYDIYNLYKITDDIESIAEKTKEIKNGITDKYVRLHEHDSTAATSSSSSCVAPPHKDVMLGCDKDAMEIKSRLCGEPSKLQVIPVVGMGGIGKTTLARNVYDDPLIMEYFHIREWVTVSQDYNIQGIVSDLLVSMKVFDEKDESMEAHHVHQNLKNRRYLIVLDDVWSAKAWDDLMLMFPDDGNGSRIMITTRLSDVATYPDPYSRVHEMRLMDEDQSWNLLRHKVFKHDPCPVELEDVGKIIVRSCRGLPLAIVVISGLLIVDRANDAWQKIAEDVKSAISANDEQFNKILSLSYRRLPHHLRPCFLYMGGFPDDYKMHVSKLIRLWVAEGFLRPDGRNKSFEETAEEYLEDLVRRSLVLVTERKSNGRIKIVSMHDLMREMCIRKAEEENFFLHHSRSLGEGVITNSHRLSIFNNELENFYGSTVRTIIRQNPTKLVGNSCCLGQCRLLRILDPLEARAVHSYPSLPGEVYELLHLRYLALDHMFKIGAAIINLHNLQTLFIKGTSPCHSKYIELPMGIWRLPQLRHLIVYYVVLPLMLPRRGVVLALQTLYMARDFVCTPEVLKMISNLKKLGISYVRQDCNLQSLVHLRHLEKLKLEMHEYPFELKHNLAFPLTLKKLALSGVGLPWEDMCIVGALPNLEVLKLRYDACVGDTWETSEGEFCQLKFLVIHDSELQYWITESSHFPRLNCLVLRHCYCSTEIPDGIGESDTLEVIKVLGLKSLEDSAKQIYEDQLINCGYSALQVHIEHDMNF